MNKIIAIIALIALLLVAACAPLQPVRKVETNTTNMTISNMTETVKTNMTKNMTVTTEKNTTNTNTTLSASAEPESKLPQKIATEGDEITFPNLKATDPDGDPIKYTFTKPLDQNGKWQTKIGDAGKYPITITASDGKTSVKQELMLVINPKNKAPTIELSGNITVTEGETITLAPITKDEDGDKVSVTYKGWMTNNTKQTTFEDAGTYAVTVVADDGKQQTEQTLSIKVINKNRVPQLTQLEDVYIKEGEKVTIKPAATDADGDTITYTYSTPIGGTGEWSTNIGDAGNYEVTVTASDGNLQNKTTFRIIVEALNKKPVIELEERYIINEGETFTLTPIITDPENDEVKVAYSGWSTTNTKETSYEDAGEYKMTVTASDSAGNVATKEVRIVVVDVNRAPVFDSSSFS